MYKKEYILFPVLIITLILSTKFLNIGLKDIKTSNIYILSCIADGDKLSITSVNGKSLKENIFIKNEAELPFGKYSLVFEVKSKKNKYISGNILEVKSSKLNKIRYKIEEILNDNIRDSGCCGLVKAVILSKKSDILSEDREMFRKLGLMPFVAISGLHMYILISMIKNILNNFIKKKYIKIVTIFILSVYSAILCFPISVLRSYIMYISSIIFKEIKDRFILSLIFILGINLYEIFNPAFIFSFLSVYILIYLFPSIDLLEIKDGYKSIFKSVIFQIILMPFQYYFMHQIGILFFLINIIITPFFSLFIFISFVTLLLNFIHIYLLNSILEQIYIAIKSICLIIYKFNFISLDIKNVNLFIFFVFILLDILVFIKIYELKLKKN